MNLEERIRQLRQAKTQIPGILARAGMNAALRAVEKAVEEYRRVLREELKGLEELLE